MGKSRGRKQAIRDRMKETGMSYKEAANDIADLDALDRSEMDPPRWCFTCGAEEGSHTDTAHYPNWVEGS